MTRLTTVLLSAFFPNLRNLLLRLRNISVTSIDLWKLQMTVVFWA